MFFEKIFNLQTKISYKKVFYLFVLFLLFVIVFELGISFYIQQIKPKLNNLNSQKNQLEQEKNIIESTLSKKEKALIDYEKNNENLEKQVKNLKGRVAGLNTKIEQTVAKNDTKYPFAVPTEGIVATFAGTYGGNMMGIEHWGVDIWTTLENSGHISSHIGNPVFSVCDGKVTKLHKGNAAVTVLCDDIDQKFFVPAYSGVFVYYGHMGNADTKELFIEVGEGEQVKKGQKIGYQGDLSDVFPEMRNVHLHISIWSGQYQPLEKTGGPHNPCLYFGGDCTKPGSTFEVN